MATAPTRELTAAARRQAATATRGQAAPRVPGKTTTFLVTLATHHERPVFGISRLAERLMETLLGLRTQGLYKLHAFVVLPTRVYLLLTPQGGIPVERAIELTVAAFARHLDTVRAVWEPGFQSHPVHSIRDLERLRTHLYQLPVRASLATAPELYPYSSASRSRDLPHGSPAMPVPRHSITGRTHIATSPESDRSVGHGRQLTRTAAR